MEIATKQRGRPKVTSDDRQRDAIVDSARRLFVERGFGNTKTEDIAAFCKISKQTLYRLFPCKRDVFTAVVESHQRIWLDLPRADDDLPLADALMQIFQADISEQADRERIDVIRLVLAEEQNNPELVAILESHGYEVARAALAEWLQRQQMLARIKPNDSQSLARMLMDMIFGAIIVNHLSNCTHPTGNERRQHIQSCVDVFLHGVAVCSG